MLLTTWGDTWGPQVVTPGDSCDKSPNGAPAPVSRDKCRVGGFRCVMAEVSSPPFGVMTGPPAPNPAWEGSRVVARGWWQGQRGQAAPRHPLQVPPAQIVPGGAKKCRSHAWGWHRAAEISPRPIHHPMALPLLVSPDEPPGQSLVLAEVFLGVRAFGGSAESRAHFMRLWKGPAGQRRPGK